MVNVFFKRPCQQRSYALAIRFGTRKKKNSQFTIIDKRNTHNMGDATKLARNSEGLKLPIICV